MDEDRNTVERKFNFTKKEIAKLSAAPEGRKQVYYTDSQMRGLELCVSGKGSRSFVFRRKIDSISRRKFLGFCDDISIEQARSMAAELNAAVGRGENPFEAARSARNELTLGELFDVYMERHAEKKAKKGAVMRKDFDRLAEPLRNRKLSSISRVQAEQLHAEIGKSRGPYSANRIIQLLRAVFNRGKAWKLFSGDNPFAEITLFEERARQRFLTDEETGRLLKALDEESDSDLRDFIVLSLFTGARKTNVLEMCFSEIDWAKGTWTIPPEKMKNRQRQVIALGGMEIAIVRKRHNAALAKNEQSDFVFAGKGRTGHLIDLKRSWTTLRTRVGLVGEANATFHDLRRSLGAAMANANINVALVKGALNHRDAKTTLTHYAHTGKQAELQARELVQKQWLKAAGLIPDENNVIPITQEQSSTQEKSVHVK